MVEPTTPISQPEVTLNEANIKVCKKASKNKDVSAKETGTEGKPLNLMS